MKYDLQNPILTKQFEADCIKFKALQKIVELKEVKNTRSVKQNGALHLFFTMVASQLNDLGLEYQYTGISGKTFELRYTPELVKTFIWKPIQLSLFGFESTTKLTTEEINQILDVIIKFFAEREVLIEFPSIESLLNKL